MDFSGNFGHGSENILGDYDSNSNYADEGAVFADMYSNESLTVEPYASGADTYAGDPFATTGEYDPTDEQFDSDSGEYHESRMVVTDGAEHFGVSCTVFDDKEELVWSGNCGGHVTSYLSAGLMKYTSFQVHPSEDIRDLRTIERGLLAATPTTLNLRARGGLSQFCCRSEHFENLQCILPISNSASRLLLGGHQEHMIEFDIERLEVVQLYNVGEHGCVILREHPRFVCHGNTRGTVVLHDPRTLRQEHTFEAHSGTLNDFDILGNYIVTCGFSSRCGQMISDQFMKVFDLRMMKMSLPLQAILSPYFVRFMPGMTTCFAAVSSLGQWVLLDVCQHESTLMSMTYQAGCSPDVEVTSFDISSSSQAVSIGTSVGSLHLFTTGSKPVFNNFSTETILPIVDESIPVIPLTDLTSSLGSIPLPYSNEPLCSDWPASYMQTPYWPTPSIDPQILHSMRMVGPIGYAPNTENRKRNQVPYLLNNRGTKCDPTEQWSSSKDNGSKFHIPHHYLKIELKYNKMGVDEFDFDFYNRTSFCSLDMSLPNSYCNAMLQMFYYIEPLRVTLLSHLCEREFCLACELGFLFHMLDIGRDQGFPCQASNFLRAFRTIPEASAMSLTISDQDCRSRINFSSKIQSWNRFILQQINSETLEGGKDKEIHSALRDLKIDNPFGNNTPHERNESSPIADIFGASTLGIVRCTRCGHQTEKQVTSLSVNLTFFETALDVSQPSIAFSSVVQNSMCLNQNTQAWCDSCSKYQPMEKFRRYKTLPSVIAMNCGLDSPQDMKFWRNQYEHVLKSMREEQKTNPAKTADELGPNSSPALDSSPARYRGRVRPCRYGNACVRVGCRFGHPANEKDSSDPNISVLEQTMDYSWVPLGLKIVLNMDGTVTISDVPKEAQATMSDEDAFIYDLMGVVSHVANPGSPEKNHLVACIKVGPTYHQRASVSPVSHWYLFNDISIHPVKMEEAVWFPLKWKTPCVFYWIKRRLPSMLQNRQLVNPITMDVFKEDKSLAQRGRKRITFTPLTADEMPDQGDLIAMDAEFVNLHREEAEIRSDGTRNTIKPSQKSVARITCIRGQGLLQATPFLDDYISTQEQVVDYVTQFSGIIPGDLDANYSQKHLTTLKSTYVKLRYLVDRGVKIVGHGLRNDLRVINMVVPQSQLIDTVHLFHLPHNRMVSLKFLAWYFLKVKIQSVTHDSIEDARTALALYHKFLEIQRTGTKVVDLQQMYETGRLRLWKVPGDEVIE